MSVEALDAAVPTPETSASAGPARKFRGKNKAAARKRGEDTELAVIRLPLVVDDSGTLRRVEQLYSAMWSVKRALQRDARDAVDAYWAGSRRRKADPAGWRKELGLSREGMERRAYRHMERAGHLGHHISKALVMHQADEVWEGISRHLFADASGSRHGRPRVGRWWDYTRIPGRARSHTQMRKWETFRLVGTLAGHLAAYRHPGLPAEAATPEHAAALPSNTSILSQPRRLPAPERPTGRIETGEVHPKTKRPKTRAATWWDHDGALAVVFAGGADNRCGDIVLPVRLPAGAGRWPRLLHFLGDPETWHKVDLVRRRDTAAPGGWAYEAHLMVLTAGYASPATQARRKAAAALERVGGVDGNVSNLSIVSFPDTFDPADGPVEATRVALTDTELAGLAKARKKEHGRKRALDRSRRATNPSQYAPSEGQQARAERRKAAGLPERQVQVRRGARAVNAAGVPRQAYRRDTLAHSYRTTRARLAETAATAAQAKDHRARRIAVEITAVHGANLTVEDCDIRTWFRLWGRTLQATTPGRLIAALDRECEKASGRLLRASTFTTALSQHCLCGERVTKTLAERVHRCPACGLVADRDKVAAALTAHVALSAPGDPGTARLDTVQARNTQIVFAKGLQEALSSQPHTEAAPARGRLRGARPSRGRAAAAAARPELPGQVASARRTTARTRPRMRPAPRDHAGKAVHTATPHPTAPRPSGTRAKRDRS